MISTFSPDVYDDAATKRLADARMFNRRAAWMLFQSMVMFIASAILFAATRTLFWLAGVL